MTATNQDTTLRPVAGQQGALETALETARAFIADQYRDGALAPAGEWLAPGARPVYNQIVTAPASPQPQAEPVADDAKDLLVRECIFAAQEARKSNGHDTYSSRVLDKAAAYLSALASPQPALAVKGLEWDRSVMPPFIASARTPVGSYRVESRGPNGWWWMFSGMLGDEGHDSEAAAKAAAQADYETRIRSALVASGHEVLSHD